ncbi:MAG: TetR family transcriptional regulator [Oxalobacter sp.]|nr:TetR family transcriptional regulator [Oxalobacter sp.]
MASRSKENIQKKKAADTRNSILDAAEDVFNDRGYSKTSLNEIALVAGVTRGAIYWHFKNKEDLFNEMCERVRTPMREQLEKAVADSAGNPISQLRRTHDYIMQEMVNNPHYRKVVEILLLKCEHTSEATHILQNKRDWRNSVSDLLQTALENAKRQGELPEDLDVAMAVDMMFSSFWGMIGDWLVSPGRYQDIRQHARRRHKAMFDLLRFSPHLRMNPPEGVF